MKNLLIHRVYHKIGNALKQFQWSRLASRKNLNVNHTLIISGDPRGGTTWLSEIICELNNTALLWEPLWLSKEKTFRNLNFSYRQFLPEHEIIPKIKDKFADLFSGKILNVFLCQFTTFDKVDAADKLLIKFCRANQILPWLINQFEFRYAPVYLVRHPCAVVASQIKQGGWDQVSSTFTIPLNNLYPEFYLEHEAFLKTIDSKVKVLAATWCLCNAIPLKHAENNKKWITITYEALVLEGEKQLNRIEERWNIKLPKSSYHKLNKASKTTLKDSPVLDGTGPQLEYWQKQLSDQQIREVMEVLKYFEIDLYTSDVLPSKTFN